MNDATDMLDVCIVGGGFAGMNAARTLSKKGINCEIYSSGYGASQLWAGTMDFLKFSSDDLEKSFREFKDEFPNHPYKHLDFHEAKQALLDFEFDFPEFTFFTKNGKLTNRPVLTTIGNLKPCVGMWGTIFHDFELLGMNTKTILIDFREFNNSVMDLVAKGLSERFRGRFEVLTLSINEIIQKWESEGNTIDLGLKLSENVIANYFDKHADEVDMLASYIRNEMEKEFPELLESPINYYLFPPVLGIKNNRKIVEILSEELKAKCKELVALSPSLMSKRLFHSFEEKLKDLSIKINNEWTLERLEIESNSLKWNWKCHFENKKKEQKIVRSKYLILATGSLFPSGFVGSEEIMKKNFEKHSILVPNRLKNTLELTFQADVNENTRIFVCGSVSYVFMGGITDEEEIKYCTGLGLAIATSVKVANAIINELKR